MGELDGRRFVITGATSGIWRATAHALAAMGGAVVVHGRDPAAVEATRRAIATGTRKANVTSIVADFRSLADTRRMASELTTRVSRIDVLVNHLAPFLLTTLLLNTLTPSPARIVIVASEAHRSARLDFSLAAGASSRGRGDIGIPHVVRRRSGRDGQILHQVPRGDAVPARWTQRQRSGCGGAART